MTRRAAEIRDPESAHWETPPDGAFGRALLATTRALAILGGAVLLLVVAVTTLSVAGRYLLSAPIPGDYEITEFGCGVAILLFFPFCEMTSGNIKAEFFTQSLGERWKQALNIVSEVAFVAMAALLGWRFVVGGLRRLADGQVYMHLGIPLWWGYIPGAIAMALLVVVCLWRTRDFYGRMKAASGP